MRHSSLSEGEVGAGPVGKGREGGVRDGVAGWAGQRTSRTGGPWGWALLDGCYLRPLLLLHCAWPLTAPTVRSRQHHSTKPTPS